MLFVLFFEAEDVESWETKKEDREVLRLEEEDFVFSRASCAEND